VDQLFTLARLQEGSWELAQLVYMCFVDLEKAFDWVPWGLLWGVPRDYGVPDSLPQAIRSLYACSKSCVRILGIKSDTFPVGVGLRQGCPLSPALFVISMDRIPRRSLGAEQVRFEGLRIAFLLFADDVVLLAFSDHDLRHSLRRFAAESEAAEMGVSTFYFIYLNTSINPGVNVSVLAKATFVTVVPVASKSEAMVLC